MNSHRPRGSLLAAAVLTFTRGVAHAAVRIYTPGSPLVAAQPLRITSEQHHYLANVMRVHKGDKVQVFNGIDGEWTALVESIDKKSTLLRAVDRTREQPPSTEAAAAPTLLFAVLKGARLSTLVEKATELGVGELRPVITTRCAVRKLNVPRLQAIAMEASEQCGRLTVPTISEPETLASVLNGWDEPLPLFVCDERGGSPPLSTLVDALVSSGAGPGILIGPEGGFAPKEFNAMAERSFVRLVSLGPNTLRAETAALAACAVLACR